MSLTGVVIPIYVLPTFSAIQALNAPDAGFNYAVLAKKGLVVHLMSNIYKELRQQSKFTAREAIRAVTAHNGKLGLNWDVPKATYVKNATKNFNKSQYPAFIRDAITFLDSNFQDWTSYLTTVLGRPMTEPV